MRTWHKLQLLSIEISLHRKHFSGVGKQRKTVRGKGFSVCCPHEKWGESQNEKERSGGSLPLALFYSLYFSSGNSLLPNPMKVLATQATLRYLLQLSHSLELVLRTVLNLFLRLFKLLTTYTHQI